jgi:4-hydroxy-3-methylbut-2-en-1-yl diphosphate synthase IspG/GcpE
MAPVEIIPACADCQIRMELLTTIPQFGSEPELRVFSCPTCGRTDSRFVEINGGERWPR